MKEIEMAKRFIPPTFKEVKQYQALHPELSNVDIVMFFHGFNDAGWIDTQGNPVRNWKLKMWTWSRGNLKYSQNIAKKQRLLPIVGKTCSEPGCRLPAVYKDTSGSYDYYRCVNHLPPEVKELYD